MDFSNERYTKVYTKDTFTWKLLDWRARSVLLHALRKVDRAGLIDLDGAGVEGLAAYLEMPLDLVEAAVPQLVARGVAVMSADGFFLPKFMEAQDANQSDKVRAAEYRGRRRDRAAAAAAVTKRDDTVTKRDDRSDFRDEPSPQLADPAEPALAEPQQKQKKQKKLARSALLPSAPDGWTPPATGAAVDAADRRIAMGELTRSDAVRSTEAFYAKTSGKTFNGPKHRDSALAKWIANERPGDASRSRSKRPELVTDHDKYIEDGPDNGMPVRIA